MKKIPSRFHRAILLFGLCLGLMFLVEHGATESLLSKLAAEDTESADRVAYKISSSWSSEKIAKELNRVLKNKQEIGPEQSNIGFYLTRILASRNLVKSEIDISNLLNEKVTLSPTIYAQFGFSEGIDVLRKEKTAELKHKGMTPKLVYDYYHEKELDTRKNTGIYIMFPEKYLSLIFCGESYPLSWTIRNSSDLPINFSVTYCSSTEITLNVASMKSAYPGGKRMALGEKYQVPPHGHIRLDGLFTPLETIGMFKETIKLEDSNGTTHTLSVEGKSQR